MTTPYVAKKLTTPLLLDGKLSDPAWASAPKTGRFADMETGLPGLLDTQSAILWDDERLHIGFWVEEPFPTAKQTERDCLVFRENDVEIFIDGGDAYYEFELNAANTIYEVFFIWKDAYTRGSRWDTPEFDLLTRDAVTFGGNFDRTEENFWRGTNPRGLRWAFLDWDLPGLETAVHVDGVLNDPTQLGKGWTAHISTPWSSLAHLANGRSLPPKDGDEWRFFIGRFQKLAVGSGEVQAAWCVSPHGVYDTHMPEKFTPVVFSHQTI